MQCMTYLPIGIVAIYKKINKLYYLPKQQLWSIYEYLIFFSSLIQILFEII